jgi:hypothetical protein
MNFTNFVVHTGVKKNPLGGGGFTGINVRGNTNVAVVFDGGSAGHKLLSVRSYEQRLVAKTSLMRLEHPQTVGLARSLRKLGLDHQKSRPSKP